MTFYLVGIFLVGMEEAILVSSSPVLPHLLQGFFSCRLAVGPKNKTRRKTHTEEEKSIEKLFQLELFFKKVKTITIYEIKRHQKL